MPIGNNSDWRVSCNNTNFVTLNRTAGCGPACPVVWEGVVSPTIPIISASGPSSLIAGWLGDRLGRTRVTIAILALSGTCALMIGLFFGATPWLVTLVALVWGFAVAPDSGQYSTAVSELSDPEYMGTALTLQTSMGFLLTLITIRLVPTLVDVFGWQWSFAILALGPLFGIWAMRRLKLSPEAGKLAGGRG